MWAGLLTSRQSQKKTHTRAHAHSSTLMGSSSWSMMRVLVLLCCTFFVVVDIDVVTSMSLDRLVNEENNELRSDKINGVPNDNKDMDKAIESLELEGASAGVDGGETDMYVLLPNAGSTSDRESVDKNIIESVEPVATNAAESGTDMVMMESNDAPLVEIASLPDGKPHELKDNVKKEEVDSVKVNEEVENEKEPLSSENKDDEPMNEVLKNDKDLEDMAFENDENISTGTQDGDDERNESYEETESMVDMIADVVDDIGNEEKHPAANKGTETKDTEKAKWEAAVEKLEEEGSEGNKEEDNNDMEMEAAAVMEDILPAGMAEIMELAAENENSREEKDESEKEVQKIQNESAQKNDDNKQTVEKKPSEETKVEENVLEESKKSEEQIQVIEEKLEGSVNKETEMQTPETFKKDEEQPTKNDEIGDSSLLATSSNAESSLDNIVAPMPPEHQSFEHNEKEKEKDELTNVEPLKVEDAEVSHTEKVLTDLGTSTENENNAAEKTSEEEPSNIESNKPAEVNKNTQEIENTLSNSVEDNAPHQEIAPVEEEPPKLIGLTQADEEASPAIQGDKVEKTETAEKVDDEMNATENVNIVEADEDGVDTNQDSKPLDSGEPVNNFVNENDNNIQDKPEDKLEEEMQSSNVEATTVLTTIVQMPVLHQPQPEESQEQQQQQQQQQEEQGLPQQLMPHNDLYGTDTDTDTEEGELNEKITSDVLAPLAMTVESSTQMPQIVSSATQDPVLNYVNASNAIQALNLEEEQKQQQTQQATENDNEAAFSPQLRRYDGAQVWRIVVQNDHDRKMADQLQTKFDGQLWKEVKQEVDYLLKPQVLADAEKYIHAANLSRIVLIDNLQQVIEVENPALDELADADNEKGYRLTWQAYHRLADIHEFYDYLAKTYPQICSVETIGYSIQRRPLKVLKISNGNAGNPGVWIDGGMHAREWISPASVTFIANQLAEGWEDLPAFMKNTNWYIHAVANPDGYEYSHTTDRLWRKNMRSHGRQCPGVDLNRNFGYKWGGKGTSANPCSQIYRGSKAFSEPETFYISKFISSFPRDTFQAYLSFHSYGQYILYPWGYDNALTNDKDDLDRLARAAATSITRSTGVKYTVGAAAITLYPAAGGSDDWAKGIANIKYTYTIEMGDNGRYGFILPASHIETNGMDAYTFIQTVARAISHDMRKRTIKLK